MAYNLAANWTNYIASPIFFHMETFPLDRLEIGIEIKRDIERKWGYGEIGRGNGRLLCVCNVFLWSSKRKSLVPTYVYLDTHTNYKTTNSIFCIMISRCIDQILMSYTIILHFTSGLGCANSYTLYLISNDGLIKSSSPSHFGLSHTMKKPPHNECWECLEMLFKCRVSFAVYMHLESLVVRRNTLLNINIRIYILQSLSLYAITQLSFCHLFLFPFLLISIQPSQASLQWHPQNIYIINKLFSDTSLSLSPSSVFPFDIRSL